MNDIEASIQDLSEVAHGGRVGVWDQDHLPYAGTVEDVDSAHGVVWILEDGIGERKMVHIQQYRLQCCSTGRSS